MWAKALRLAPGDTSPPAAAPPTLLARAQGSEVEEEAHSLIEGALRSVRKDVPGAQAAGAPLPTPPGGATRCTTTRRRPPPPPRSRTPPRARVRSRPRGAGRTS